MTLRNNNNKRNATPSMTEADFTIANRQKLTEAINKAQLSLPTQALFNKTISSINSHLTESVSNGNKKYNPTPDDNKMFDSILKM